MDAALNRKVREHWWTTMDKYENFWRWSSKCDHNEGNCQICKVGKLYLNLPTIGIIIIGKIYNSILRIVFVIRFDIVQRKIPLSPFICCEKQFKIRISLELIHQNLMDRPINAFFILLQCNFAHCFNLGIFLLIILLL